MSTAPKTFPNVKQVTVSFENGMPSVDPEPIEIWSTKNESVEWVAEPRDLAFTICFAAESPFSERHFHEHRPASGPIKTGATGRYKYTIEVNGVILDPGVIIRP
ncbi:MAG TPA: hypothetical protein VMT53_11010 [Terriglobales bacterium]|nr:hypothetical protein [Terriglobales bacterium]